MVYERESKEEKLINHILQPPLSTLHRVLFSFLTALFVHKHSSVLPLNNLIKMQKFVINWQFSAAFLQEIIQEIIGIAIVLKSLPHLYIRLLIFFTLNYRINRL